MKRDLYDDSGIREVDRRVSHPAQEDCVLFGTRLEFLQNNEPFCLLCVTVDEGFTQLHCVKLQSKDIVQEDDDLVSALFVIVDQELTNLKFLGVQNEKQILLLDRLLAVFIFEEELRGQGNRDDVTRGFGDISFIFELHPISLVQLWTDNEIQIIYFFCNEHKVYIR